MRIQVTHLLLSALPLLVSCALQPIALAPVGPHPAAGAQFLPASGEGRLQVFTETDETEVDEDVPFYPHRDYEIYTADGKRFRRVWNHQNREDGTPALVTLPAGEYLVKGAAELYGQVTVPVVVRPGQTTRVVLQPGWKPSGEVASSDLVRMPDGYPIGWRAELSR